MLTVLGGLAEFERELIPVPAGLRWWFVCPHLNRRVRKLYLPLGGRHFGRGALMSLPTPPNERLSMTEPSGALASCA
jgi:hypothetical protein